MHFKLSWALNSYCYISFLRMINTGSSATAVRVAVIDGATGVVGSSAILNAALPPGAAITYTGQQIEAALGVTLPAAARPLKSHSVVIVNDRNRCTADAGEIYLRGGNESVSSIISGADAQIGSVYSRFIKQPATAMAELRAELQRG